MPSIPLDVGAGEDHRWLSAIWSGSAILVNYLCIINALAKLEVQKGENIISNRSFCRWLSLSPGFLACGWVYGIGISVSCRLK